jgi:hypothetical protein
MSTGIVVAMLLAIMTSLGAGLVFLYRDGGTRSRRVLNALNLRVALSLTLIALLLAGYYAGLIQPNRNLPIPYPGNAQPK